MTEPDYILATDLQRVRTAKELIGDLVPSNNPAIDVGEVADLKTRLWNLENKIMDQIGELDES